MPSVQTKPKMPKAGPPASGSAPKTSVDPSAPAPLTYSYTLGRLRPRFVGQGAWHELASLVPDEPLPPPDSDAFDRLLVKLFGPTSNGELPPTFYLARSLVWPIVDSLGIPQAVVVPADDEEISELIANLPTSAPAPCSGPVQSLVRGFLVGFASGLDTALDGLPLVAMASAFPFTFSLTGPTAGMGDDQSYDRLFREYQPLLANNGLGNEQRSINLVLTTSKSFYELASRLADRGRDGTSGSRLVGVTAQPVEAPRSRPQVEVVFSFQTDATGVVQRWFQRVGTPGPFPFFATDVVRPYFGSTPSAVQPRASGGLVPQQEAVGVPSEAITIASTRVDPTVIADGPDEASASEPVVAPSEAASPPLDGREPSDG